MLMFFYTFDVDYDFFFLLNHTSNITFKRIVFLKSWLGVNNKDGDVTK